MIYSKIKGKEFSKITLGTAQLGFEYGIANKIGKPSPDKADQIINFAIKNGINSFDTAQNYGNSEQILGNFFSMNKETEKIYISTKIPEIIGIDEDEVYEKMKISILKSQNLLQKKSITYLLHEPGKIEKDNLQIKSLKKLKKEKLIDTIGISVYNPNEIKQFMGIEGFDSIQIPINIFDNRVIDGKILNELKNYIIFGRSIFLQGLLLLKKEEIPIKLKFAEKFISKLNDLAKEHNLSAKELSFMYVKDIEEITSLVIGIEEVDQLKENIELLKLPKIDENLKDEILKNFANMPEEVINPTLWNNREENE